MQIKSYRDRCCKMYPMIALNWRAIDLRFNSFHQISPPTRLNFSTKAEIFAKTVCFLVLYCGLSGLIFGSVELSAVPFSVAYSRFRDALMFRLASS